jgi:hypothetical protein
VKASLRRTQYARLLAAAAGGAAVGRLLNLAPQDPKAAGARFLPRRAGEDWQTTNS